MRPAPVLSRSSGTPVESLAAELTISEPATDVPRSISPGARAHRHASRRHRALFLLNFPPLVSCISPGQERYGSGFIRRVTNFQVSALLCRPTVPRGRESLYAGLPTLRRTTNFRVLLHHSILPNPPSKRPSSNRTHNELTHLELTCSHGDRVGPLPSAHGPDRSLPSLSASASRTTKKTGLRTSTLRHQGQMNTF